MRALCRVWLTASLLLFSGPTAAAAGDPGSVSFLPPVGCLPADGGLAYDLYLVGRATKPGLENLSVSASKGQVLSLDHLDAGLVRLRFKPPRLKQPEPILFSTRSPASQTALETCPHPAGQIRLRVEPGRLLAGQGQQASLHIEIEDSAGLVKSESPPQITVNVGQIDALTKLGPGRFRAVYTPPSDPFPQVAIIMVAHAAGARMDRVAVGRAIIPITARIELPGKTASGTSMQMVVAGRRFGPVRADQRGRFSLPILVPPGYGQGQATSIDRVGNRRTRDIDLFLPETNQLGLWAFPMRLPADGLSRSRLLVTTINRFGEPADIQAGKDGSPVRISATRGTVSQVRRLAQGLFEAYYTAPERVGSGQDELQVTFPEGGSKSRASITIQLAPGPAARVELSGPDLLPADGSTAGSISLRISDDNGNPVAREVVQILAKPGRIMDVTEVEPGLHRARLQVDSEPETWVTQVSAEVKDRRGDQPARILLGADGVVAGEREPAPAFLVAAVVDAMGLPVAAQRVLLRSGEQVTEAVSDEFGRVRFELKNEGADGARSGLLTLAGKSEVFKQFYCLVRAGVWRLLPVDLDRSLPASGLLRARTTVTLFPAVGLQLTMQVAPAKPTGGPRQVVVRVTDMAGTPLAGRQVMLRASAGSCSDPRETAAGRFESMWTPPAGAWQRATLSAVEPRSGIGAVLVVNSAGDDP